MRRFIVYMVEAWSIKEIRFLIYVTLCGFALAILVAACAPQAQPYYTKSGKLRDTMFSVEHRGNGAVLVWVTHDDTAAICFSSQKESWEADSLLETQTGEVLIAYESSPSPHDPNDICRRTETSATVYVGVKMLPVPSR